VHASEHTCPHCGADVELAAARHAKTVERRRGLMDAVRQRLVARVSIHPNARKPSEPGALSRR